MFSVRELSKRYPNARDMVKMMTTTTIGAVMPQFKEDYGEGKNLDIVLSPSHDLFLDGVKNAKPSGIYMDKNGNFKAQVNIPAQINLEKMPGMWEPIRNIYVTLVARGRISFNTTTPDDVIVNVTPKAVEIANLKVMKGEEDVQMESMMIQSVANIQLDQMKKMFKTSSGKLNTLLGR